MEAIEALLTRNSVPKLTEPAPSEEELNTIFKAGLKANDHRRLRPWKFLRIQAEGREKLGQLFVKAKLSDDPAFSEEEQLALSKKPLRAPVIICVVAAIQDEPKVPEIEQIISAGGAAQLMSVASHALGYGAIWRTGAMAFHPVVHQGLGLNPGDKIVGFIYLGTAVTVKPLDQPEPVDFVEVWGS